jgi:single-strand DNA-binding protein
MAEQSVTMIGTIVAEPELRYMANGNGVASFRIAVARRFKRQDEWEEETTFLSCNAYGTLAENLVASCPKGTRVIVTGYIRQRDFETQEGGKRTVLELNVDDAGVALRWATAEVSKNARKSDR